MSTSRLSAVVEEAQKRAASERWQPGTGYRVTVSRLMPARVDLQLGEARSTPPARA